MTEPWDEPLPPLAPKWSGPLSYEGLGPVFTATWQSDCESCSDPIMPGDDARSDGAGAWIHAQPECERVANPRPPRGR